MKKEKKSGKAVFMSEKKLLLRLKVLLKIKKINEELKRVNSPGR